MTATPPVLHVLIHSPGGAWAAGVPFRDQPGVRDHVDYMAQFLESGQLVIGGPFLDDSGGMMVLRAESLEAATAIAQADPTVRNGLLAVAVRPWMVAMASVELAGAV